MNERSSFFLWVGAHRRSLNIAGLILVLVLSVICYHEVAGFEFLTWDDPQQIIENQMVLDVPGVENTLKIFGSTVISHYQPLTTLSMNIVNWLFGTDPGAFHLFSLLLHLANVALVYLLVSRLFPGSILPFFVAAFFAVHPMRVESVAWITEQKGLLSSLFLLSSLLVYTGTDWAREGRKTGRYVLSLILFILAMLSKASAISLPFILLGYELLLKRRRLSRRVLFRLAPFAAAGLLLMLPTFLAHGDTGGFRPLAGLGVLDRTAIVVRNLFFYLRATLLPAGLSTVYSVPEDLISLRTFAVALALAGGVLLLIFNRRLRSSRMFLFGAVFYLVSIAPMLQVVPFGRSPAANRFSYLASVGVLICLAVLLRKLWRAFRWSRIPLILLAAGALTASCVSTSERLEIWRDSVSLWTDVLVENPDLSFP